ncbi:MAG: protein-L-isoaspartate O-methyltransferase family protein [Alphaproteobacteria bacterium]
MSSISSASDSGFDARRINMVDSQIRANNVTSEAVIEAIETIARELFVPDELRGIAYVDDDIALEGGRCVMEPRVLARMIQTLQADTNSHALIVGAGTGYAAAVLSRVAQTVVAEESIAGQAEMASEALESMGITNVVIEQGALMQAAAEHGPFDVILFGGSIAQVPANLADFLEEGGRAMAVVSDSGEGYGAATLFTKFGGHLGEVSVFDAAIPALPEFDAPKNFNF